MKGYQRKLVYRDSTLIKFNENKKFININKSLIIDEIKSVTIIKFQQNIHKKKKKRNKLNVYNVDTIENLTNI